MDNTNAPTAEKLSQNIQALVGEIGERQVLLRLSILVRQAKWEVFHNLGEAGYDILLLNPNTNNRIRIEVKTRQKLFTTGKHRGQVQFFLTNGERQACDFLIAYFLDKNEFYIVPASVLLPVNVNKTTRWRFTMQSNKKGTKPKKQEDYLNKWQLLHPDFTEAAEQLESA